jgi:hypothetical protein
MDFVPVLAQCIAGESVYECDLREGYRPNEISVFVRTLAETDTFVLVDPVFQRILSYVHWHLNAHVCVLSNDCSIRKWGIPFHSGPTNRLKLSLSIINIHTLEIGETHFDAFS